MHHQVLVFTVSSTCQVICVESIYNHKNEKVQMRWTDGRKYKVIVMSVKNNPRCIVYTGVNARSALVFINSSMKLLIHWVGHGLLTTESHENTARHMQLQTIDHKLLFYKSSSALITYITSSLCREGLVRFSPICSCHIILRAT